MTAAERARLRHLIDQARRKKTATHEPTCAGCGGPIPNITPSCGHCRERVRSRERRAEAKRARARERYWEGRA